MPGFKQHVSAALFILVAALAVIIPRCEVTAVQVVEWAGCLVFGSLFPDLDTKSIGQKWFYRVFFIVASALFLAHRYYAVSFVMLIGLVPLLVNHRGLFHATWFLATVVMCAGIFLTVTFPCHKDRIIYDILFFWLGAFSHVWLDRFYLFKKPAR